MMAYEKGDEKAFAKKTKEIYDRAEANLSEGLGAAIEAEKAKLQKAKDGQ